MTSLSHLIYQHLKASMNIPKNVPKMCSFECPSQKLGLYTKPWLIGETIVEDGRKSCELFH